MVRSSSCCHRSHKRSLRQACDEGAESYIHSKLVQLLPDAHHDSHLCCNMVSYASKDYPIPMELGYSAYFHIHMHRRFCLSHIIERFLIDDFRSVSGAPQLGDNFVRMRSHHLQGAQSPGKNHRPRPDPPRNGPYLGRNKLINNNF